MEYKEIKVKGRVAKAFPKLIKEVIEAAADGWVPQDNFESVGTCRMYNTNFFVVKLERALVEKEEEDISSEKGVVIPDKEPATDQAPPTVAAEEGSEESEIIMAEDTSTGEVLDTILEETASLVVDGKQIMLDRIAAAKTKKELVLLSQTFEIDVPEGGNVNKIRKILNDTVKAMGS